MTSDRTQRFRYLFVFILSLWALISIGFRYLLQDLSPYLVNIEKQIEQKTPYEIKIDKISGRWLLYSPVLELEGVELFNRATLEPVSDALIDEATQGKSREQGENGENGEQGASEGIVQRQAFIRLDKLAIEFDLFESLFFLKPRFKAVLIDGLKLSIQQDSDDKKVQIVGLEKGPDADPKLQKALIKAILNDYILSAEQIYIKNAQINIALEKIAQGQLTIKALLLDNEWFDHLLFADIELNDGSPALRAITFKMQFQGNPLEIETFSARGFLGIDDSDYSYWSQQIEKAGLSVVQIAASLGIWFEIQTGTLKNLIADVELSNIEIARLAEGSPQFISQLDFSVHALGALRLQSVLDKEFSLQNLPQQWDVKVKVPKLYWAEQEYKNLEFIVDHKLISKVQNPLSREWGGFDFIKNADSQLVSDKYSMFRFSLNYLPLALLQQGAYLVDAFADHLGTIEEVSITGQINSIQAIVIKEFREEKPRIYASAEVKNLGFSEFLKIPAVNGVDFYVELAPRVLGLSLAIKDANLAKSDHLFRGDVQVNAVTGNVLLEQLPNETVIHSDVVEVRAKQVQGEFVLSASIPERLYNDGIKEIPAWSLQGSLAPMSLENARIFFPSRLPEGLLSWVDSFLQEGAVSGDIFLFAFAKKREPDTFITLAGDINLVNGHLDYMPGKWPKMENVNAQIYVHNDQVNASVSDAKLFQTRLYNGQVSIPSYLYQNLPRVKITADASGGLEDIQKLFLNSELKESIGNVVADWQLSGAHQAKIDFDLPISDQKYPEPAKVSVNLAINQGSIYLPDVELGVSALDGDIRYSLEKGLSAESFQGTLFGKPISGHIDTAHVGEEDIIQVFAKGSVDQKDLTQWQDLWLFNNMAGQSEFNALLSIGEKRSIERIVPTLGRNPKSVFQIDEQISQVKNKTRVVVESTVQAEPDEDDFLKGHSIVRANIYSDLQGLSVNFPGSYSKKKNDRRSTHLQADVLPDALIYRVDYNGEIKAAIKTMDNEIERARIHFGEGEFSLPSDKGLTVTGNVSFFNFDEWLDYLEKNILDEKTETLATNNANEFELDPAAIVSRIDVLISHFVGFGVKLENVKTFVVRGDKNWRIDVENDVVAGFFIVPDEELISRSNPIIAELEYLKISDNIFLDTSISIKQVDADDEENQQGVSHVVLETDVELKPEDFPFLKLKVKSLTLDKTRHGRWEIDVFPDSKGMDFDVHQLNYGLMAINGKGRWDYTADKSITKFKGHVRTAAVTRLFTAFNLTPSAKSKGLMAIDISWPGDPFSFDSEKMKGKAGLEIFDGSIIEIDIKSKKFRALGIFNLGFVNDILTLRIFKKIGQKLLPDNSSENERDQKADESQSLENKVNVDAE